MGMPLKSGRGFSEADNAAAQPVVIVNEALVRKYFSGKNAIGRNIQLEGPPVLRQIVGIVGDVKPGGLDSEADPEVYMPWRFVRARRT
jgi:putative ABC transport system permease protein